MTQESLKRRMATGETIVFEATLPTAQDIKSIMTLARHHDYAVMIVDFYNTRPHQVLAANQERPERSRVGEHSIMRVYQEGWNRSEEHTSELPSLMRISYAVFCLTTKKHASLQNTHAQNNTQNKYTHHNPI